MKYYIVTDSKGRVKYSIQSIEELEDNFLIEIKEPIDNSIWLEMEKAPYMALYIENGELIVKHEDSHQIPVIKI